MILSIQDLKVYYGKARSLNGVSLQIETGQVISIIGPVGAGKSTLLDAILGLNNSTGVRQFEELDLSKLTTADIVSKGIGYAPERGHLFTQMSVMENLLVGAYRARDQIERNLELVFELFPVLKPRKDQETGTQSGGERQMVSLGRALMSNPRLLLVDEPTIGLSPKVCQDIARALKRLNQEHGMSILIAEQNVNFALSLAEKIYLLESGDIVREGTREELQQDDTIRSAYFGGKS
ncbi:MAG: branched-chain amino acid transport system ATP-binding protein [Parasphingorhabdus sp.]|jgi:branched-chain amino acid transport system ATP-binding protein